MAPSASNRVPTGTGSRVNAYIALAIGFILALAIAFSSTEGDTAVTIDPDGGTVTITRIQHIGIGPSAQSYVETTTVITAPLEEGE